MERRPQREKQNDDTMISVEQCRIVAPRGRQGARRAILDELPPVGGLGRGGGGGSVLMSECLRMMPRDVVLTRCGTPPSPLPFVVVFLRVGLASHHDG